MTTLGELTAFVSKAIQDDSFTDADIKEYLNLGVQSIAGGMPSVLGSFITPPLPDLFSIGLVATDTDDAAYSTYAAVKTLMSADDTLVFTYNDTEFTVTLTGTYTALQTNINTALVAESETAGDVVVSWTTNDLILTCAGTVATDTIVGGIYTDTDTTETVTPTDTDFVAAAAYVSMPTTFQRGLQFASNSSGAEIDIHNSMIEFATDYPLLDGSGSVEAVIEQGGNLYYQNIPTSAANIAIHFYRLPVDMTTYNSIPDGIPLHLQVPLLVNFAALEIWKLKEDGLDGPGVNTAKHGGLFNQALRTLEMSIPFDARSLMLGA